MVWFIAYLVTVVIYFYITYHIYPLGVYHSLPNSVIGFFFPLILLVILGVIGKVPERKGIIKPAPPKESPSADTKELDAPSTELSTVQDDRPFARGRAYQENHPESAQIQPQQTKPTIDDMLHTVDLLDGLGFERWCTQLLRKMGYSEVEVTKASGDQGVDITAVKDEIRYAIQCKCYSSDLGNHPVQEVHAGKSLYGCHVGVVMTNRYFTSGAKELAKATGILLWDRDKIKSILRQLNNPEYKPDSK